MALRLRLFNPLRAIDGRRRQDGLSSMTGPAPAFGLDRAANPLHCANDVSGGRLGYEQRRGCEYNEIAARTHPA